MTTVVVATRNKGKLREIAAILALHDVEFRSLDGYPEVGEIDETGVTFAENARIKADAVAAATGLAALADDSGLVVDALGGAPGVYSRRFAGSDATDGDNNRLLLERMADVADDCRAARFVCALCLTHPDGSRIEVEGRMEGMIGRDLRGANGFGYDPLFVVDPSGTTLAQLADEEKNKISHRRRALDALAEALGSVR